MTRAALALALAAGFARPALAQSQTPPDSPEITVRAERRRETPGALTLPAQLAREGAGTQADPAKAIQSLPGVGHGAASEAEPVLWGSAPGESQTFVDGVEIPRLFHGSGVRSVVPALALSSVTSTPGAYAAEHGRALGGLVELSTRAPALDHAHLRASVDLLDASALGAVPVPALDGAAQLALRYGYVNRWLPSLIDPGLRGQYRIPAYGDGQAQLTQRLGAHDSLRWVALASSDSAESALGSADPARRRQSSQHADFWRIYADFRSTSPGTETTLTPFVGWDRSSQSVAYGAERAALDVSALRYGLRARYDARLSEHVGLALGVDGSGRSGEVARSGSFQVPPREGSPYPFGTPPGTGYAADRYRAHVLGAAVFVEARWGVTSLVTLTPALRFEPTLIETSRARPPSGGLPDVGVSRVEAALEPRLSAEARLSRSVRLFAAGGRYHQPPALSELGARFGNPDLPLASSTQLAFGESVTLPTRTRVELTAFSKWLDFLPTATSAAQPEQAQGLVPSGEGRAFGAQLFVRQPEVGGFSGWLSATLSRSERRDDDGSVRLSDYDAPLVLAVAATQRLDSWRFGGRLRFASGAPRTPVTGAYFDVAAQRYAPLLGAHNSERLRDFFQLDLRIDRRFELDADTALELYLDALNVTFRQNQEELAYSGDFSRVGSVTGLPPLALVGVSLER